VTSLHFSSRTKAQGFTYKHKFWRSNKKCFLRGGGAPLEAGYGLDNRGSIFGCSIRLSLLHSVEAGTGSHPDPYSFGTWGSFPRVNKTERKADHSFPSSVQVYILRAISPVSQSPQGVMFTPLSVRKISALIWKKSKALPVTGRGGP
jgi:hypothetical protein